MSFSFIPVTADLAVIAPLPQRYLRQEYPDTGTPDSCVCLIIFGGLEPTPDHHVSGRQSHPGTRLTRAPEQTDEANQGGTRESEVAQIRSDSPELVVRPCTLVRLATGLPPDTRLLPAWVTNPRPGLQTRPKTLKMKTHTNNPCFAGKSLPGQWCVRVSSIINGPDRNSRPRQHACNARPETSPPASHAHSGTPTFCCDLIGSAGRSSSSTSSRINTRARPYDTQILVMAGDRRARRRSREGDTRSIPIKFIPLGAPMAMGGAGD